MNEFGARIRSLRARLGLEQKALAKRIGLTSSYLSRIENGSRKPPKAEVVLRMVAELCSERWEAEGLVRLAGFDPIILETGAGLSYSAPAASPRYPRWTPYNVLHAHLDATLEMLEPRRRRQAIQALILLLDAFSVAKDSNPAIQVEESADVQ